jgi:sigma-B regulation protein RsbU (phosphoserine phosphatase)
LSGLEAIRQWWERIFALFPDWTVSISDVLVDGDRVAFFGSAAATDRDGWFGQAPTGERFDYRSIIIIDLVDGKIVRDERIYDLSGVLERLEKTRLDKEMKMAADVQRILLPRTERSIDFCDIVADSIPSRAIGGDFFESIPLPGGGVTIALGDVAGKGAPAALLGAMIQGMLVAEVRADATPSHVVASINSLLIGRNPKNRFCTFVYGALTRDGRFTYVNAGHNPPLLVTRDGIRRLAPSGPVLGVFADAVFVDQSVALRDGDMVVFFSDGVTEARNASDEEFGEQRLIDGVRSVARKRAAEILDDVLRRVREFAAAPSDDMTVVVMMYRSQSEEGS